MKAVMYGAGNIGRGFIGMLFSASGYEVTFVDVAEELIEALNRENTYPVRIVSNEGFEDIEVLHVCHSHCRGRHYGNGRRRQHIKIHCTESDGRNPQKDADGRQTPKYHYL